MHILYNNGKGEVYQSVVRWLESSHHQLLVTAVLAVGNFARQDNYCEKMMNEHIFDKLLGGIHYVTHCLLLSTFDSL